MHNTDLADTPSAAEDWRTWQRSLPATLAMLDDWITLRASQPAWYRQQQAALATATASDGPLNLRSRARRRNRVLPAPAATVWICHAGAWIRPRAWP